MSNAEEIKRPNAFDNSSNNANSQSNENNQSRNENNESKSFNSKFQSNNNTLDYNNLEEYNPPDFSISMFHVTCRGAIEMGKFYSIDGVTCNVHIITGQNWFLESVIYIIRELIIGTLKKLTNHMTENAN